MAVDDGLDVDEPDVLDEEVEDVEVLEEVDVLDGVVESDEVDEAAVSFFLESPEPELSVAAGVDALLAAARESVL